MPAELPTLQRSSMPRQRLSSTGVTEYWIGTAASVRLDARELDHLGPLFGFVGDELAELGRRACKHCAAHVRKPRLQLRVGEAGIDLLVELVDHLNRRIPRHTDAVPDARLVARQELTHGRDARQQLVRARRGG